MKKLKKNIKGITLIALVVTIIVLLILAGITINLVAGKNGLIQKAKDGRDKYVISAEKEQIELSLAAANISGLNGKNSMSSYSGSGDGTFKDWISSSDLYHDDFIAKKPDYSKIQPSKPATDVYGKAYDTDGDGKADLLFLSNSTDTTYSEGNLIKDLGKRRDNSNSISEWSKYSEYEHNIFSKIVVNDEIVPIYLGNLFSSMKINENSIVNIKNINFSRCEDITGMFSGTNIENLDLSWINTESLKKCQAVFSGCIQLKEINVDNWKMEKVNTLEAMFNNTAIQKLDLSTWDIQNDCKVGGFVVGCKSLRDFAIFNMSNGLNLQDSFISMISGCNQLETIKNLGGINVSNKISFYQLFAGCTSIKYLDLSKWNTENIKTTASMFAGCQNIKNINLSNWNVKSLTDMSSMFAGCGKIEKMDFTTWKNTEKISKMSSIFAACSNIKEINMAGLNLSGLTSMNSLFATGLTSLERVNMADVNVENVTSINSLFASCGNLTEVNISNWNVKSLTNMSGMFAGCGKIEKMDFTTWKNTENLTNMGSGLFDGTHIKELNLSGMNLSGLTSISSIISGNAYLQKVDFSNTNLESVTDFSGLFGGCPNIEDINFENCNLSNLKNMNNLCSRSSKLKRINFKGVKTGNIERLGAAFCNCNTLENLDLSYLNVSPKINSNDVGGIVSESNIKTFKIFKAPNGIENMQGFFRSLLAGNDKIEEILMLDNINTSNCTNLSLVFEGCNLKRIDLSGWDTSKVTDFENMFHGCLKLENVKLSNLNVSNAKNLTNMFCCCNSLKILDLSNWDTSNVTSTIQMFAGDGNLEKVYIGNKWNMNNVENDSAMFDGCYNIVGEKGTKYESNKIFKDYARIDNAPDTPGYFWKGTASSDSNTNNPEKNEEVESEVFDSATLQKELNTFKKGWKVEGDLPFVITSPTGHIYNVDSQGVVTYSGSSK